MTLGIKTAAMLALISLLGGNSTVAEGQLHQLKEHTQTFQEMVKPQRNALRMQQIVKRLKQQAERTPYVFSGDTINGWDCSGLTRWAYRQIGVTIPHGADDQAHLGVRVSRPQVGDIVVMAYKGTSSFYHAALYIGNGKIINANRYFGTTKIESLKDFRRSQIRYVHLIPMEEPRQLP
jgi:cell wall-associated NlpC family hydrolase